MAEETRSVSESREGRRRRFATTRLLKSLDLWFAYILHKCAELRDGRKLPPKKIAVYAFHMDNFIRINMGYP